MTLRDHVHCRNSKTRNSHCVCMRDSFHFQEEVTGRLLERALSGKARDCDQVTGRLVSRMAAGRISAYNPNFYQHTNRPGSHPHCNELSRSTLGASCSSMCLMIMTLTPAQRCEAQSHQKRKPTWLTYEPLTLAASGRIGSTSMVPGCGCRSVIETTVQYVPKHSQRSRTSSVPSSLYQRDLSYACKCLWITDLVGVRAK